MFLKKQGKTL